MGAELKFTCEKCHKTHRGVHTCEPDDHDFTSDDVGLRSPDSFQRRGNGAGECPACGWALWKGPHSCPPGTPRLSRADRPHVGTSPTGDVRPDQLDAFIDAYIVGWMEENLEKFAEDWWAKRAMHARWQEEQDIINEIWDAARTRREVPIRKLGTTMDVLYVSREDFEKGVQEREKRTYAWVHDQLRGRPVWRRIYDE